MLYGYDYDTLYCAALPFPILLTEELPLFCSLNPV